MAKEYFNEATQQWVKEEDASFLEKSYDYLTENVPPMLDATSDFAKENFNYASDKVKDFIYGPEQIPTLSGDIYNTLGPPKNTTEAIEREIAAETAKLSGLEAMAIGTAREGTKLGQGLKEKIGMPPELGPGITTPLARPGVMEGLEEVEDQFPVAHGVGATIPYLAPGFNAPLKAAQVGKIPMKTPARAMFDVGKKAPGDFLSKNLKGGAIDLRMLPEKVANSPFANTLALGTGVGAIHPDMTAGEGAFYSGAAYGIGKGVYGKLGKPKNYNLPEKNAIIKWGKKAGYDIDPGVQTGDIRFQQLDQAFFRNADTAGPFQQAKLKNRSVNNRIVSRLVGRETDNISDEWFESTGKQLKARADELYDQLTPTHNSKLHGRTDRLLKNFEEVFGGQNIPGQGQYNPNWDPAFKTQVDRVWKLFEHPAEKVPIDAWKGVRGSLDKVMNSFAKRPDKAHLIPYLDDLSNILDDMLEGSTNKKALSQLKRNKMQKAVRWHTMASQKIGGEVDMKGLGNIVSKRYASQIRGIEKTGNRNLDDFYNAIKLDKIMRDTHGASLGVSDKVGRLFTNPASRTTGRLGYLFSKNAHDIGRINSFIINRYRNSPNYGLPTSRVRPDLGLGPITYDELVGSFAGRYAISEQ